MRNAWLGANSRPPWNMSSSSLLHVKDIDVPFIQEACHSTGCCADHGIARKEDPKLTVVPDVGKEGGDEHEDSVVDVALDEPEPVRRGYMDAQAEDPEQDRRPQIEEDVRAEREEL